MSPRTFENKYTQKQIDFFGKLIHSYHVSQKKDESLSFIKEKVIRRRSIEDYREFDDSIARQVNQLTMEERARMYEEIHGVAEEIIETPELIASKLRDLYDLLEVSPGKPEAYYLAMQRNQDYIRRMEFGLMFLRAERFQVAKAVTRLLLFLQKKLEYFGLDALTRRLRLSDLSMEEQVTLGKGAFQVLPFRDRSGRVVFFECVLTGKKALFTDIGHYFKVKTFLCIWVFEKDEYGQKNGCIHILWQVGDIRYEDVVIDQKWVGEANSIGQWLPIRVCAVHICNDIVDDDPIKEFWTRLVIVNSAPEIRFCFQVHRGSVEELMFKLRTYGVPEHFMPVKSDGSVDMKSPKKLLQSICQEELQMSKSLQTSVVILPRSEDVLFGRGEPLRTFIGNQNYRNLIEESYFEYQQLTREGKTEHTWRIFKEITDRGGRFLKRDEQLCCWVEVPGEEARKKISKKLGDIRC